MAETRLLKTTPRPKHTPLRNNTWLESEEYCYPNGGFRRRYQALDENGSMHWGWATTADTYFSIPTRDGGWLAMDDGVLIYHPKKVKQQ